MEEGGKKAGGEVPATYLEQMHGWVGKAFCKHSFGEFLPSF
jgi:hypothetical protein